MYKQTSATTPHILPSREIATTAAPFIGGPALDEPQDAAPLRLGAPSTADRWSARRTLTLLGVSSAAVWGAAAFAVAHLWR